MLYRGHISVFQLRDEGEKILFGRIRLRPINVDVCFKAGLWLTLREGPSSREF